VRSSGEGVLTSQKRLTDTPRNAQLVRVKRTLRCERLGRYELVAFQIHGKK
jgi:hypothetical protein